MSGENIYDISSREYIPEFLSKDQKLNEIERELKEELLKKNIEKFKKHGVSYTSISSIKQINGKIIELLEEHKYASTN